jgi:nucleotidyltransferase substrate binding protein (TIGR01987 family)
MSEINYDKLKNSLKRLEERYNFYLKEEGNIKDKDIFESIKESCIQRFEVCYDTLWKHLSKYLENDVGIVEPLGGPNHVFKIAFSAGIISDSEMWIDFNKKRGDTSHDYSGDKAQTTFEVIGSFVEESIALYEKMTQEKWSK